MRRLKKKNTRFENSLPSKVHFTIFEKTFSFIIH